MSSQGLGRALRVFLLGFVLLMAGLGASWAQDIAAPWINAGEARMGSAVRFESGGGDYRVITSGVTRPELDRTGCTITTANERELRVLGGEGVNASDRLGVSRVLGFEAPAGTTSVTCADRYSPSSTLGRFQIVSADGPVSIAVLILLGLGSALLIAGVLLGLRAYRSDINQEARPPD